MSEGPTSITVDDVLTSSDGMQQVRAVGEDVYWLSNIAAENSRGTLKCLRSGTVVDLTPGYNVRTRVNEYGGGVYDVDSQWLVFADDLTSTVYARRNDATETAITSGDPLLRYAGFRLASDRNSVLAVREDHRAGGEPRTELVELRLDSSNADGGQVIFSGADFYGRPAYRDGQIAWAQWNHPNMPWDDCELWTGTIGGVPEKVAGGSGVSAVNPFFLEDGRLAWFDDSTGYWNITIDDGTRFDDDHDHCSPPWTLLEPPLAQDSSTTLIGLRYVDGAGEMATFDLSTGKICAHDFGTADVESLSCSGGTCFTITLWPTRPPVLGSFRTGELTPLIVPDEKVVSVPESLWFDGPAGPTHALLYRARNAADSPAPTLVLCHGGPTAMARPVHRLDIQFWCDNGIQILDVNYSGSSGFGRAYRDRLKGNWGILDVADVVAAVKALIASGRIDQQRVAIAGSSAGGYTVLQALTTSDIFTAGISSYGIGDLTALATDTHKFESRYLDGLVGRFPEQADIYAARSPINHVGQLTTPMLILQGRDDLVVPLNQAQAMADAVAARGLSAELIIFDGEGHGFRNVANRRTALEAQLRFLNETWQLNR